MLDDRIKQFRRSTFATSTKSTYRSQLRSYLKFCTEFKYSPVPATNVVLARYIAYLSCNLNQSSIGCYLNVIRVLHLELGFQNPLHGNFYISSLLKGVRRELAQPPAQKLPITPSILLKMYSNLNLARPILASFWAACLVAFFSFFRKSTLLPASTHHICETQLCIQDIKFLPTYALLRVKHTKPLQFRDRLLEIPLPKVNGSPLCPVGALQALRALGPNIPSQASLFSYPVPSGHAHLHYQSFSKILAQVLSLAGIQPSLYSGHSFRRGGASFAFSVGIPSDLIKIQGDWSSDCYLRYLNSPLSQRLQLSQTMSSHISNIN